MATLTVYPTTGDNDISSSNAVFATAHDATTGTKGTGANSYILCRNNAGAYDIYRGFMNFDTSALGAGATVTAVSSFLWSILHDGTGTLAFWNVFGSTASEPIVAADYDLVGTTAFSTAKGQAGVTDTAYNSWVWNATGIAAIDQTGVTKVSYRETVYDVANTAPAGGNVGYLNYYNSAQAGTSNDPYLEITYTAGGSAVAPSVVARRNAGGGVAVGGALNF